MFLLLLFIPFSYALRYEDCLNHSLNRTNIDLFYDSNIFTGRYDDCIISCDQRIYFKYVCYSEIGFNYDLWWSLLMALSVGLFLYSIYSLKHMIQAESDRKIKFNPQFIIVSSTVIIAIFKIIWLACIFNGRDPYNVVGGIYLDLVAVKISQCVALAEIFLLILVWKTIVNTTSNMQKINNLITTKNYIYTSIFIAILMICVIPFSVLGSPMTLSYTMAGVMLCLYVLFLMIGGIIYGFKLTKILRSGIDDEKRKKAIINIRIVNNALCLSGLCLFTIFSLDVLGLFKTPVIRLWLYWFNGLFIEFIMYYLVTYSVSHKAKQHNNPYSVSSTLIQKIISLITPNVSIHPDNN